MTEKLYFLLQGPLVSSCDPPFKSVCTLPKDPGPCEAAIEKYYFHLATRQCKTFNYGGCYGNGNRFDTLDACEKTCKDKERSIIVLQACEVMSFRC